jgi:Uma2 family endonuclease
VVELVFNRQRDRVRDFEAKRRQYLAIGIQEYWIIDRFHRIMTISAAGQSSQPNKSSSRTRFIGRRSWQDSSFHWPGF